jgi:hypothetical protein
MKEVELLIKFQNMNEILNNRYSCYHCKEMIELLGNDYSIKEMLELCEYNLSMEKHKLEVKQLEKQEI